MPNWCSNIVKIYGSDEHLQEFMERVSGYHAIYGNDHPEYWMEVLSKKHPFCFNAILPSPPEVSLGTYSNNGFGWCVENWGTKWDIHSDDTFYNEDPDDCDLSLSFSTAWGPPLGVYNELAQLFPNLVFDMFWIELGMAFGGHLHIEKGQQKISEISSDEPEYRTLAEDIFDIDSSSFIDEEEDL